MRGGDQWEMGDSDFVFMHYSCSWSSRGALAGSTEGSGGAVRF